MNRSRRMAEHELRKVYAQVPELDCKGLCQESCGPILMSDVEELVMIEACGGQLPVMPTARSGHLQNACPLLTQDGKCSIYQSRPLICRLWGAVDHPMMRCPHGCKPRAGLLPDRLSRRLLARVEEISRRLFSGRNSNGS